MMNNLPLPLDECLNYIQTLKHGSRNRALLYLRQCVRLRDIASLRVLQQVLDSDGEIKRVVMDADGFPLTLQPRARSELSLYLCRRFGNNLRGIDLSQGLFPTEKNPYGATMKTLPQLFWAMDVKLKEYAVLRNTGLYYYTAKVTVDEAKQTQDITDHIVHNAPTAEQSTAHTFKGYLRTLSRTLTSVL
jgi:hypothetical protein